jgi:NitT/TauT family transport system ATP-binding protein
VESVALRFEGVTRRFEGVDGGAPFTALEGLDLAVEPGSFTVLLGPSGCGKSTLLRLAAGLDAPQAGRVVLREGDRDRAPAGGPTGFVFQEAHLLPWRTLRANVALPFELRGELRGEGGAVRTLEAERAVTEALERVGLAAFADRMPHELSGGMKMRASLARALVSNPRLFLLDEPFGALDELTRLRLDDELRALAKALRMTVLFVTHSIQEAAYLADRVVVFSPRPARIVADVRAPLPEARTEALRFSDAFASFVGELHAALVKGGA